MTIRNILLCLTAAASIAGCGKMTGSHLPMSQMEDIIYDISIAEAYSTKTADNANFGGYKNIDTLAGYYKDILAHYKVSKEDFEQSMEWYKSHPSEMDSIYTHISVRADKDNTEESRKKKLAQPQPAPPPTTDTAHPYPGKRKILPQTINKP